jgi:hypothetical protein
VLVLVFSKVRLVDNKNSLSLGVGSCGFWWVSVLDWHGDLLKSVNLV